MQVNIENHDGLRQRRLSEASYRSLDGHRQSTHRQQEAAPNGLMEELPSRQLAKGET